MKNLKVCLISLGCEKNLVDSEIILGMFNEYGYIITPNKAKADVIVVNTCGFIEDAKKEAIDTILDALDYQKNGAKIIVVGCLVQRYYDDLVKEIPEVDLYVRIKDYLHLIILLICILEKLKTVCMLLHRLRCLNMKIV